MAELNVVQGEAPESDDEGSRDKSEGIKQSEETLGIAVEGEAPESDEDLNSKKSFQSAGAVNVESDDAGIFVPRRFESLLQRKLRDMNAQLWQHLSHLVQNTVTIATKQLLTADQLLLKSQVTLQSVSYSMKTANSMTKQILDKTKDVATANFIPPIKI